LEIPNKETL